MRLHLMCIVGVLACGGNTPRPDDMSAAAHRAEAEHERAVAQEYLVKSSERGVSERPVAPGLQGQRGPWIDPHPEIEKREGPPDLEAAAVHSRHAREHELAAAELERYEDAECQGLPADSRAACPLLRDVVAVEDIRGGVSIRFGEQTSVKDVVAHIRCHLAYARARAFAHVEDCPLYVRGVEASVKGPHAVTLTTDTEDRREMVKRIRQLAREQSLPSTHVK